VSRKIFKFLKKHAVGSVLQRGGETLQNPDL